MTLPIASLSRLASRPLTRDLMRCGTLARPRLLADGLTLKEIGDHLGHRSTSATRTYAKVDIVSLREVGDFDLGDLQ